MPRDAHARRMDLLAWLRGRSDATAALAAERFGVSPRTILRDVAFLRDRGEPIASSPGPGGGLVLRRDARLAPVRLDVEEVLGLTLAAQGALGSSPRSPFGAAATRAAERLIASLSHERAKELRRLLERIVVGKEASEHIVGTLAPVEEGLLASLEEAFATRRLLRFCYIDARGRRSSREAEAQGLLVMMPVWYIVAQDRLRDAPRFFRMDRMTNVEIKEEVYELKSRQWLRDALER